MFRWNRQDIQKFARASGFIQNYLEKVLRLVEILNVLSRHPFLKDCFALKGGTALNLFIFDMPRLSVDIDLNYIRTVDKEYMLEDRKRIINLIQRLFSKGYRVNLSREEYALSQFELQYTTFSDSQDKLKVEINYLHRQPIIPIKKRTFDQYEYNVSFPILGVEELIAGKIVALLSRYTSRDLYDIYRFSQSTLKYNQQYLRSLIRYYGIIARTSIFDMFQADFDNISHKDVQRHLRPLLVKRGEIDRNEMVLQAQNFLENHIVLSPKEEEALKVFYEDAVLDDRVLFPEPVIWNSIKKSPALHWKIQNIESYVRKMKH